MKEYTRTLVQGSFNISPDGFNRGRHIRTFLQRLLGANPEYRVKDCQRLGTAPIH